MNFEYGRLRSVWIVNPLHGAEADLFCVKINQGVSRVPGREASSLRLDMSEDGRPERRLVLTDKSSTNNWWAGGRCVVSERPMLASSIDGLSAVCGVRT